MSSKDHRYETESTPAVSDPVIDTPADSERERDQDLTEGDAKDSPITPEILDQLCVLVDTVIKPGWKENCLLREKLKKLVAFLQQKSKDMGVINSEQRRYHTLVKEKHQATAEKFKVLSAENKNLKEEVESMKSRLNDHSEQASATGPAGDLKTAESQKDHRQASNLSVAEREHPTSLLQKEQEKVAELTRKLEESKKREDALKARLMVASNQRSEVTDELGQECHTLPAHQELANSEGENQEREASEQLKSLRREHEQLKKHCEMLQEKYECKEKQLSTYQNIAANLQKDLASEKELSQRHARELEKAEILSSQLLSKLTAPPRERPKSSIDCGISLMNHTWDELKCHLCDETFLDPASRTLHIAKHFPINQFLPDSYEVICKRFDDFCVVEH